MSSPLKPDQWLRSRTRASLQSVPVCRPRLFVERGCAGSRYASGGNHKGSVRAVSNFHLISHQTQLAKLPPPSMGGLGWNKGAVLELFLHGPFFATQTFSSEQM